MNRIILLLLLICTSQLYSLEIWLNGSLYRNYRNENLRDLSYTIPDSNMQGIALNEIVPVMDEIHSFRFISDSFILETDYDDSLYITIAEDQLNLSSSNIGEIKLPAVLEIKGIVPAAEKLLVWFENEEILLKREIDLFGTIHKIKIEYRQVDNLESLLEYCVFNDVKIPDLIIYNQENLNRLYPLLAELPVRDLTTLPYGEAFTINGRMLAHPFKISRPIYLEGSSGGSNSSLVSDFGNLNLLYPLMMRFGSDGLEDSLYYLKDLYNRGIYHLSENPDDDFISGAVDSIYTGSEILGKIPPAKLLLKTGYLPQLGNENPLPLLNFTVMSIPKGSRNISYSKALMKYLSDSGVQQRINPESGYLPFSREVYDLLKDTSAGELLLDNLDNALWLPPDDHWDKFRFVIPKIYRLVITGRLTMEEGMAEINSYMIAPDM